MLFCSALQAPPCSIESCLIGSKILGSALGEKSMNAKESLKSKSEVIKKRVWELKKGEKKRKKECNIQVGI